MGDLRERHFVDCACSKTGKMWYAAIELYGNTWRFVDHYMPEQYKALQLEAKKAAHREEILRRMNALTQGSGPVLPAPPQIEMNPVFQDADVSANTISSFGFQCPYCNESRPLRCVVCQSISCMGEIDGDRRTVCARCGSTLQFSDSPGTDSTVSASVKTQKSGLKAGENALPDRSQQKLLPGQEK